MDGDRRVDQVAAKGSEPSEDAIFVRAGEPAVADDVGHQDRRELPGLGHCTALRYSRVAWRKRQITRDLAGFFIARAWQKSISGALTDERCRSRGPRARLPRDRNPPSRRSAPVPMNACLGRTPSPPRRPCTTAIAPVSAVRP